ncbi:MAG: DesA/ISL3 alpha bundle tail domain-containing protein [Polaromonas sp.]
MNTPFSGHVALRQGGSGAGAERRAARGEPCRSSPAETSARKLLVRDESLLDEVSKSVLERVLRASQSLETVYSHKQRLQEIWKGSNLGQESLLHALQEWCRQAEAPASRY